MRSRRRSARARPGRQGSAAWIVGAALLAGFVAAWQAPWLSERVTGRTPVDPERYTLWVPGAAAAGGDFADAAWSGIADGELVLQPRAFGLAERLIFNRPEMTELELRLAPDSPALQFTGRTAGGGPTTLATLGWEAAEAPGAGRVTWSTPGVARIRFEGGLAFAEGTALGASTPFADLAPTATARLAGVTLRGAGGSILLEDEFQPRPSVEGRLGWALAAGAAAAALVAALTRPGATAFGRLLLLACLSLPVAVLGTRYGEWAALLEALRLPGVDVGPVRQLALAASVLPAALGALLLSDRLDATEERVAPPAALRLVLGVLLVVAASRDIATDGWWLATAGALAAAVPWGVARAGGMPAGSAWWRDLPAGLTAAALGWGVGLPLAMAWRAAAIVQDAPALLKRGTPGAGVNGLLLLALLTPIAGEGLARSGPLHEAWSRESLLGASLGAETAQAALSAFSEQTCGVGDALVVSSFGGSSTGGAWQFRGRPDAFFPAALHERLCARGIPVRSLNYGDSGRDSFDIARAATATFAAAPPDVVVLYLGVNDLLTEDSPMTRRERQAALDARSAETSWLADLAASSRLVTAGALLLRDSDPRPMVASVPLPDAETNVREVVAGARVHGARVLLVPELATETFTPTLRPYAEMLARIAAEAGDTAYLDPAAALGPSAPSLLADRNHLTPEGAAALADALLPLTLPPEPSP